MATKKKRAGRKLLTLRQVSRIIRIATAVQHRNLAGKNG